jgi:hypothetical protein
MLFFKGDVFIWLVILCVCFVDHCLCFCPFSFGHCVVCPWQVQLVEHEPLTLQKHIIYLWGSVGFILLNLLFWKCSSLSSIVCFILFTLGHCIVYSSTYSLCLLVWYFQTFLIHIIKINIMCIIHYTCIMYVLDW